MTRIEPYRPRTTSYRDVYHTGDWRLKRYGIVYGVDRLDWSAYEDVWPLVDRSLPQPAIAEGRPGVGFVICHRGASVHYVVLAWWANQNELPFRLFVKGFDARSVWRVGTSDESFCVYDLEVIWCERCAYVETVMQQEGPDVRAYLDRRFSNEERGPRGSR